MTLSDGILLLANIPILVATLYAGFFYQKLPKEFRLFSKFLFLTLLVQIPSVILYLFHMNNMPILHIYTLFGGIILIQFYRALLTPALPDIILNSVTVLFALFTVINSVLFEEIFTFNKNALTVQAIILVILSLSYFNISIQENNRNITLQRSTNWINSGIFIYFASNLLLYYFGDDLMASVLKGSLFREVWMLHTLFVFTAYTLFFIGLWKVPKR